MTRVRIIKDFDMHRTGEVKEVTPNVAHGLIDRGVAILSKDISSSEIKVKKVASGNTPKLRTNNSSRRKRNTKHNR